jgi:serine/threonine protein kinase
VKDPVTHVTYSLKKVRKNKVIETGQQEHVRNERAVLALLDSDFCCRMYGTFQDTFNIYFLMEPILGGELFTVLRWNKKFSEKTGRFYAACVVLAFESLHSKNIIYRDLKPENLLIAKNGYCKLVDFGFAKRRNNSCTLCGTPEYLSPEVIQNYAQSFSVDWWALGVFIFEMIVGHAPFQDDPDVKMYEKILTHEVKFPETGTFTPRVTDLVHGLLIKNAYKRYGAGANGTKQLMDHAWFNGLDWNKMRNQDITPPYVPNIQDDEDPSNYDNYPEEHIEDKLLEDPTAYEWSEDF